MNAQYDGVTRTAQDYYNSDDADNFYAMIWGGEDIHVGLYDNGTPIAEASRRTVQKMADTLGNLDADKRVLDIGGGYAGAARYLARTYGCRVVSLNLSERENERARRMNAEQGLAQRIEVADGSFEDIPYPDASFDVAWSEDAMLHSGDRRRVWQEVHRVLKPGGDFIFTDPMQAEGVSKEVLQPILDRIHLDGLGSYAFYRRTAAELGFAEIRTIDYSDQLPKHYGRVREELLARADEVAGKISQEYVDHMLKGLSHWVDGGNAGRLNWGIMHFRKA
ncbi:MAG TPA: methyltransferase domain-containing protein [Gammaproteobacteria bacterium]|nr:methyltransferase domain-containing protein [Gammaproteobacteria bacterium]